MKSLPAAMLVALALVAGCTESEQPQVSESATSADATVVASPATPAGLWESVTPEVPGESGDTEGTTMNLQIGGRRLTATLANNSSAQALTALLQEGPITIRMSDYANMEKVGELGASLPTNDEDIMTGPGDLILYQGNRFVIYYGPNSWSLTQLGKIDGVTPAELKSILGAGEVSVTLSLD